MKKTRIFEIGAAVFIAVTLVLSTGLITATEIEQTKTDLLKKYVNEKAIPEVLNEYNDDLTTLTSYSSDYDTYNQDIEDISLENLDVEIPDFEDIYPAGDPPDWADGWFVGVWFNKQGEEWVLLGYLAGYYDKRDQDWGLYAGVWNNTENTTAGAMGGVAFSIFTYGQIYLPDEEEFPYSGFLFVNETHFLGRVMAFVGPPVYMGGIHQPLENGGSGVNAEISRETYSQQSGNQQYQGQEIPLNNPAGQPINN